LKINHGCYKNLKV